MAVKKQEYLCEEGNAGMKDLLGGKGARMAEMTNIDYIVKKYLIRGEE